jgi:hypothetical protein
VEFAFDSEMPMADDDRLCLSQKLDDVFIVEVTRSQCKLNGPWTSPEKQNVHRVLAAIGCIPRPEIQQIAESIYKDGVAISENVRIRLVSIGRERNPDLDKRFREVLQLTWDDVFKFIWDRFDKYREQKRNVEQWDQSGKYLRGLADRHDREAFLLKASQAMGIRLSSKETRGSL